ncbi:hypothetical protein [Streptomyces sp. MJM8645]|uniref:hypothetical protein n=1 Tax=Streptomycetaceae TaxID=2062 RepID=UPI0007AF58F8|nr:hypothetical protein [Streptomyces sp. MJM8645]
MTEKPTTTHVKRPAGEPMTEQEQRAGARTFAEQLGALLNDFDAETALARLRTAREHAAAGHPIEGHLAALVIEAAVDGRLPAPVIAAELDVAEDRVRAVIDGHMLFAYRVDLQTGDGWEVEDYAELAPVEIVDADPKRNAERFAQETVEEVLADHAADEEVTAARVLVWPGRPGRDEDAAAVVERARG